MNFIITNPKIALYPLTITPLPIITRKIIILLLRIRLNVKHHATTLDVQTLPDFG